MAGNAADAISTYVVLKHNPLAHEANPFLPQNGLTIVLIKGLITVAELLLFSFAASHGLPTAANVITYIIGIVGGAIAVNNLRHFNK